MTRIFQKYLPLYAPDAGAGAAGGDAAAAAAGAAGAGAGDPWYKGVDAETLGYWQNKGWALDDPKVFATSLNKSYRELEKHMGAPPDQILVRPKVDAKPEEHKAFWAKLGAAEAKDYDFSTVKLNGEPLDDALAATMRDALASAFVPKDKAVTIAAAVAKHLESKTSADTAITAAKLAEEKANLKRNWTPEKYEYNLLKAMDGARRLGPEFVTALEKNGVGYAAIMEGMRKIGVGTSEDTFVERGASGGAVQGVGVTTREGAAARLADLQKDIAWGKRLTSGDQQARQEFQALTTMIEGVA